VKLTGVAREVVGLRLRAGWQDGQPETRQEFSIVLTARPLGGQSTQSSESSEVRWVPEPDPDRPLPTKLVCMDRRPASALRSVVEFRREPGPQILRHRLADQLAETRRAEDSAQSPELTSLMGIPASGVPIVE
jgi:hypothetical protein